MIYCISKTIKNNKLIYVTLINKKQHKHYIFEKKMYKYNK